MDVITVFTITFVIVSSSWLLSSLSPVVAVVAVIVACGLRWRTPPLRLRCCRCYGSQVAVVVVVVVVAWLGVLGQRSGPGSVEVTNKPKMAT